MDGPGYGVKSARLAVNEGLRDSADWGRLEFSEGGAALTVETGSLVSSTEAGAVLGSV